MIAISSPLWTLLRGIASISFLLLRVHFRESLERAAIHLGHFLIRVAVIYAGACIVATGVGRFATYTCSFAVLSRLPICHDTSPQTLSNAIATSGPPIFIDPHTHIYEKVLDEAAHGAPLALNLVKAERLVAEMVNIVEVGPLSLEFKREFRMMFFTFNQEAKGCRAGLESLDSGAVGLLLR